MTGVLAFFLTRHRLSSFPPLTVKYSIPMSNREKRFANVSAHPAPPPPIPSHPIPSPSTRDGKLLKNPATLWCTLIEVLAYRLPALAPPPPLLFLSFSQVNDFYQTSNPRVYACGDVIGYPALASTSMEQARNWGGRGGNAAGVGGLTIRGRVTTTERLQYSPPPLFDAALYTTP